MTEGYVDTSLPEFGEWCDKYYQKRDLLTYATSFMLWLGLSLTEFEQNNVWEER